MFFYKSEMEKYFVYLELIYNIRKSHDLFESQSLLNFFKKESLYKMDNKHNTIIYNLQSKLAQAFSITQIRISPLPKMAASREIVLHHSKFWCNAWKRPFQPQWSRSQIIQSPPSSFWFLYFKSIRSLSFYIYIFLLFLLFSTFRNVVIGNKDVLLCLWWHKMELMTQLFCVNDEVGERRKWGKNGMEFFDQASFFCFRKAISFLFD